ncbi:MAG: gas vesicle protein [Pseudomonadota bacterium]
MNHNMAQSISGDSLADVLERVLDKGVVVAGDVSIAVGGVELLTIKLRLLVTTVDKAMELGINWWERDPALSATAESIEEENRALRGQISMLEHRLSRLETADSIE